ncbi:MAG: beta-galactosidase, partial [Cyclobacteriaceae bacterium]|nr:beta-galactosidase [Cyclobacteriaceae bacterium]
MKKAFRPSCFVSIVLCLVYSSSIAQRHTETLNEVWKFHKGNIDSPFAENEEVEWEVVNLPHSWNTEDVLDETPGYYRGVGWYKRNLQVPALFSNQKVFLYFEGANQKTKVFMNGNQAGKEHIGGYTPFAIEITDFLAETANELMVKVDNSYDENIIPLSGDFNFYGGIYRDVYLVITNPQHFDLSNRGSNGVFITTPEVSETQAKINIKSTWVNQGLKSKKVVLKYTLLSAQQKEVAATLVKSKAEAGTRQETGISMDITNPSLWSPDSPYLYTLRAELLDTKGNLLDVVDNPVGFRWFSFDPKKGFSLNGKPLKLIGSNRHQDYYHKANALTNEMHRYDMKLLKDMGINFIRISHYPHDPAMLEMCDMYGFIASLEIPFVNKISTSEAFLENTENMMREAITSNFNHPCIVAWCTGNETTMYNSEEEAYQKQRRKVHIALDSLVRAEDPTRYTYTVAFRSPDFHS